MQSWGAKSFADDLDTGQSVVFSRAATILRSIETKLLIGRFVEYKQPLFLDNLGTVLNLSDLLFEYFQLVSFQKERVG